MHVEADTAQQHEHYGYRFYPLAVKKTDTVIMGGKPPRGERRQTVCDGIEGLHPGKPEKCGAQ